MKTFSKIAGLSSAAAVLPLAAAIAAQPVSEQPVEESAAVAEQAVALDDPQPAEPAPFWQAGDIEELLSYIDVIDKHGLSPSDYDPDGLRELIQTGDHLQVSAAATERFEKLVRDLARGHAGEDARLDWHIVDTDLDRDEEVRYVTMKALYDGAVTASLDALMPTHPQYEALKKALAKEVGKGEEADAEKIAEIRLNMDRWRWLPQDLGERYIIVNVPAYTAALVEDGKTLSRHRAVAGAVRTPTPQLSVEATGVIFNPYWNVPKSVEADKAGKPGFEPVRDADGNITRWRQPPGPNNALGQVKFVMYNPHLIYLHDTNARGLFDEEARAESLGCIRTENILKLATILLEQDGGDWSAQKTADVVNSGKNRGAKFVKPIPVHIVYFSAVAKADGDILVYDDIYTRDAPVIAALNDAPAMRAVDPLAPIEEEVASIG